jgi:glycosyltransferase involved in cell wall biosynthesis
MKRLVDSKALVTEMGKAGRAFAEQFTWEKSAEQTNSHLESVAFAKGSRNG